MVDWIARKEVTVMSIYKCDCGGYLQPVWFREDEYRNSAGEMFKTGRTRKACSHLQCETCLRKECVDDSFDGEWK